MTEQQPPPTPPKISPIDIISVQSSPTRQPPLPALPTEYDGDCSKGLAFLTSCQTYIWLCLDSFPCDQTKITWALSYMKSGRAAKWAAWIFKWEEDHEGYSKFLDWDEFQLVFWKDFCPTHSDTAAINKLESTSYFQKASSVDNYLDEFMDLIAEAGYTDPKKTVVKFWKGLDPQIQNTITTMAYGCPQGLQNGLLNTHFHYYLSHSAKSIPAPFPSHPHQSNSRQFSTHGYWCQMKEKSSSINML